MIGAAGAAGVTDGPDAAGATTGSPRPAPVRQRAVVVIPSTGEHDSRTWRIATALVARGHEVTVLGRLAPGLPPDMRDPAGYRIVRVPVSAVDGLPLPGPVRRAIARARGARGRGTVDASGSRARAGVEGAHAADPSPAAPRPRGGVLARGRRLVAGTRRMAAIALTVRSQARGARAVAPAVDLVHGMAYMGIPVALAVAKSSGAAVVYDARDIYVDAGNLARLPGPMRAVVAARERRWARAAGRVVTVNRPYAQVMADRWDLPLPAIAMNCAYRTDPRDPPERRFHEHLGLPPGARVVLYQGGFSPGRGIEQLVAAIRDVPGAVLVLLGYGALLGEMERLAADPALVDPVLGRRVRIMPAVPPEALLGWVAAADLVAMPIQPTTLNHRLTTPNKLFEAMAVGVPVVASDLPGMAPIVRETRCGVVCDPTDPAAIAAAIRSILDAPAEERRAYRDRALAAAHGTYCWERQVEVLLEEYGRLTGRPW
jgi:glycosyltransferase involved in cell wall biosynthesis